MSELTSEVINQLAREAGMTRAVGPKRNAWHGWEHELEAFAHAVAEHVHKTEAFSWVVEGRWSSTSEPEYWVGSSAWSSDHTKALRFARRSDARQAADMMLDGVSVRICEHGWSAPPPPAPAPDCQHCGGHPGGVDGKGTPCPACGSPGLHRSDCAVNNGPALPVGECDCQPMAKAFIEDVRRSRWLEREHVRCQADCRDECRFPACKCPLRHTTDCDKTLLPGNPRAICTCGADANNRGREIRVNPDGSEYQPPPAPATEGKP